MIDQLDKRGADVLRLWVASQNYQDDIRCSRGPHRPGRGRLPQDPQHAAVLHGRVLRLRPGRTTPPSRPTTRIDRWMRMELHLLIRDVRAAYDALRVPPGRAAALRVLHGAGVEHLLVGRQGPALLRRARRRPAAAPRRP